MNITELSNVILKMSINKTIITHEIIAGRGFSPVYLKLFILNSHPVRGASLTLREDGPALIDITVNTVNPDGIQVFVLDPESVKTIPLEVINAIIEVVHETTAERNSDYGISDAGLDIAAAVLLDELSAK